MTDIEANFWVLVQPAPDVPGTWVAHCLDLDVVTQGESFRDSLVMLAEALAIVMSEDIGEGLDPLARPSAPPEDWEDLHRVQRDGRLIPDVEDVPSGVVAMQLRVRAVSEGAEKPAPAIEQLSTTLLIFKNCGVALW